MRAVNLIPLEQRTGQPVGAGRSQGAAYAVLVLIAGFAIMAYAYGSAAHEIKSQRSEVAALNARAQQAQAAAERLTPYTSFIAQRDQRVQAVEGLIDSRFDWAHTFHEFGRVLPSGVAVTSLTGSVGAAKASGSTAAASTAGAGGSATPAGSVPTFTIAGCATSQPTVALMLQRLRLIDGVKEVTLQSSTAGSSSSGAASTSAGGCGGSDPVFSVDVVFDALPSSSTVAATATTKTVSDRSAGPGAAASTTAVSGG
jgi:Tfp pilus assembly protein PilN